MINFIRNVKHALLCRAYHWLADCFIDNVELAVNLRCAARRQADCIY
jgi:hypothetical protein